jgi:post-segregation antitoxin (ccd killing protein)
VTIQIDVAPGELIDKITILEIKAERIQDASKLKNVRHELILLVAVRDRELSVSKDLAELSAELKRKNEELWRIEDEIRECERRKQFDSTFIALARAVYVTNDERCAVKRRINELTDSSIREEKSYAPY